MERPKNGRGDRIRTCDPLLPKQMRYQTALLPECETKELTAQTSFGKAQRQKDIPERTSARAETQTSAPEGRASERLRDQPPEAAKKGKRKRAR